MVLITVDNMDGAVRNDQISMIQLSSTPSIPINMYVIGYTRTDTRKVVICKDSNYLSYTIASDGCLWVQYSLMRLAYIKQQFGRLCMHNLQ